MDKNFNYSKKEEELLSFWEEKKLFEASVRPEKKPFAIILPPPNANGSLHLGHAMFVYEDVMIRFHKLLGYETLWLPGTDHAGIETQFVFEKKLRKEGKSRFDFEREELFQMIWDFVSESKGAIQGQLRRLGFGLDWSKEKYTMDQDIVKIVYETFEKLFDEGLIYRDNKLVNYCTRCGTSFSDLETQYVERIDPLYYMKYGPFTIATVRPETKFRDTALAVNPKDVRYKKWLGKTIEVQGLLGPVTMTVIADPEVDPKFGTGIMKVTPAHDLHDFELGKKYRLPVTPIITTRGRMDFSWFLEKKDAEEKYRKRAKMYHNMKVGEMRKLMVEHLKEDGLLIKTEENYSHRIATCYRCGTVLEPLPLEQWFVKIQPLAREAKKLIEEKKITLYPRRYKKIIFDILDNFVDWNISRQIVWGIRIPAYFCQSTKKWFVSKETPSVCNICQKVDYVQDTDTFDTWFSSAQWPFATLRANGEDLYEYFYPTAVMETGHDILRAWVARMIMVGYFVTGKPPFKNVYLHGMVRDRHGQKMSKSKGNVINPLEMIDKYGTDAFRASLVFGIKEGGDVPLSDERIIGMRNFANKVWNMGRFLSMYNDLKPGQQLKAAPLTHDLLKESQELKRSVVRSVKKFRFSEALGAIYEFMWHRYADYYIEKLKEPLRNGNIEVLKVLKDVYFENIRLLHPFMPFVTETVWQEFHGKEASLLETTLKE